MASFFPNNRSEFKLNKGIFWLLIMGGIIGSLIGFVLNQLFIKPIYSAQSSISAVINFYRVGHLSQYEQDQYIGHLITHSKSPDVINSVISELTKDGNKIDHQSFLNICFIERNLNEIIYRCVSESPTMSKQYADKWREIAFLSMSDALNHARQYETLVNKQNQLENCIELSSYSQNSNYFCNFNPGSIKTLSADIRNEFTLSKGLFPGISILEGTPSKLPDQSFRNDMNIMVLSGALFGLATSIFFSKLLIK